MVFPVVMYKYEKAEELKLSNCGAEEALVSPLDSKEIKAVNPHRHQSCTLIGRTDAEAEVPIHWSPNEKS